MQAYSDVPLHHDVGYFVRLTGINPVVASITILAVKWTTASLPFTFRTISQTLPTTKDYAVTVPKNKAASAVKTFSQSGELVF